MKRSRNIKYSITKSNSQVTVTKFLWLQFSGGCTFEMCSAVRAAILFNQDTLIYIGAFLPLNAQFLLAKSDLC